MIDKADTMFILVCAAAMLLMIPALEKICTGFDETRRRTDGQSWICLGVVVVIWMLFGFSLTYGTDHLGLLGGGEYLFLKNVNCSPTASFGETIPPLAFFMLQTAMACIAVVLAAVSARLHQKAYLLFVALWSCFVYIPLAHMVWGGGLLSQIGFMDYGGGAVIHICAGASALAAGLFIGKKEYVINTAEESEHKGMGLAILLFGWVFCYSSRGIGNASVFLYAAVNAVLCAAAGMLTWYLLAMVRKREEGFLSMQRGCLAGLAGIAAGAAYITPMGAFVIGVIVASVCYCCMYMKEFFPSAYGREIWIPHGIGGLAGTILLGIFADSNLCVMPYARGKQLIVQAGGAYAAAVVAFFITWVILLFISRVLPLYLAEDTEERIAKQILENRKKMFDRTLEANETALQEKE
ncbi:ammonium transporter [Anaerotignum sp.]